MNSKTHIYRTLFFSTLKLSACTFGGGFVIVALMRKKFTDELHWIEEQEMLDLTALAQSAPGPMAVNLSILVGYRAAGVSGALTAIFGTVLPPLVIISVISLFYAAIRDNPIVNLAMGGMMAGAAAVVCDVVLTRTLKIIREKRIFPVLVLLGAFAGIHVFHQNIMLVLLLCGAAGVIHASKPGSIRRGAAAQK